MCESVFVKCYMVRVSALPYELLLAMSPERTGDGFHAVPAEILEAVRGSKNRFSAWLESAAYQRWDVSQRSICPWPEKMTPAGRKIERHTDSWCPHLAANRIAEARGHQTFSCANCSHSSDLVDEWRSDEPSVSITFGPFDFALHMKGLTFLGGSSVRSDLRRIHSSRMELVSIPGNRILSLNGKSAERPDLSTLDADRNAIVAYVFVQPNQDGLMPLLHELVKLRDSPYMIRARCEVYLTLSSLYPVYMKLEAPSDQDAYDLLWRIYGLKHGDEPVALETWTIYGLTSGAPPQTRATNGQRPAAPLSFLLLTDLKNHASNADTFQNEVRSICSEAGVTLRQPSASENPVRLMFGFYDYCCIIEDIDSITMANVVVNRLRGLGEGIVNRMITLPIGLDAR